MRNKIYLILTVGFFIRIILLLIDRFWFRLPQGGIDTENFDIWAYNITLYGPHSFWDTISNGVYFFSSFGALLYSLFGHNSAIWAFTMILFGVGTIYNVYKTTLLIANDYKLANKAAWVTCLFPNIAVLSVLVLREAPIHFFVSLAIYFFIKFLKSHKVKSLIFFLLYTIISTILHSGMIAVLGGFLLAILFFNPKAGLFIKIFALTIAFGGLYFINSKGIGLSKFGGSLEGALDQISEGLEYGDSGAVYPEWLHLQGGLGDLWKLPIRIVAFICAPFLPFMAKTSNHYLGVLDGVFYFLLFCIILRKRSKLNKEIKGVLIIVFSVSTLFSLGYSNFGTNIRHRAKIFPLITIAAFSIRKDKYVLI